MENKIKKKSFRILEWIIYLKWMFNEIEMFRLNNTTTTTITITTSYNKKSFKLKLLLTLCIAKLL